VAVDVGFNNVVRAPTHHCDQEQAQMNGSHWGAAIPSHSAPWTEFYGRHIILSLPTSAARTVPSPSAVMAFWDEVVEGHFKLAGMPLPLRKERIVADVQISAGYMHSGYACPACAGVHVPSAVLDIGTTVSDCVCARCLCLHIVLLLLQTLESPPHTHTQTTNTYLHT